MRKGNTTWASGSINTGSASTSLSVWVGPKKFTSQEPAGQASDYFEFSIVYYDDSPQTCKVVVSSSAGSDSRTARSS